MRRRKAVILLSRQPLRPDGRALWVQQTVRAVRWIREQNLTLVSSLGLQTWELVTSLGVELGLRQDVFVPAADELEFANLKSWASDQFELDRDRTYLEPVLLTGEGVKKDLPILRDKAVVEAADLLIPVSVRAGGNMDSLISEGAAGTKEIMSSLQIEYQRRTSRMKYDVATDALNAGLDDMEGRFLIHWTRSSSGPWPDELRIDYWRGVIESTVYPRSARHTLRHIFDSGKIIASPRYMPGGVATVSFTGLAPSEALPLMRWRARYHEMSFEPYGIAIDKEFALAHGVKPVEYYASLSHRPRNAQEDWRCQSQGRKTDWRQEHEYRCRGDFDLSDFPSDKIRLLCYRAEEARQMETETGLRTVSIFV